MRDFVLLFFLTFVLSAAKTQAAPQTETTYDPTPFVDEKDPQLISIRPELRDFEPSFLLGTALGYSGGPYLERATYSQGLLLSVRYMPLLDQDLPSWDYQLQISEAKFITLGAGYRLYCCPEDPYLPYLRLGAQLVMDGKSELAGLVAIRRWRAQAAVGIGENFSTEFGLGVAITGVDLYALFSYNWIF